MIQDLLKAFQQLADKRVQGAILRSVALGVLTFVGLVGLAWGVVAWLAESGLPWLDALLQVAGVAGAAVVAWLLFPAVVSGMLGVFAEEVVDAVEMRHHPHLPPPRRSTLAASLAQGARLGGLALLLNLLALPLYLLPGPNLPAYLLLNGYLLGREYFEVVALRRLDAEATDRVRRRWRLRLWAIGAVIAPLLLIPLVNLVAPVIGVALMTLRFHRWANEIATTR